MAELPSTPMLDKMRAVRGQSHVKSIEELLAEYFEVDLDAAERERRVVLEYVRRQRG